MLRRMLLALVLFSATCSAGIATTGARSIEVVNLMPSFFQASTAPSLSEQVQRFKERVLYPNHALYHAPYFALDDPHIAWYLRDTFPALPQIRQLTDSLGQSLPTYETAFASAFPKFDPETVRIYLMPSMGTFDGMTAEVNGKHGLLIGVDNLSRENLPTGVFVDHEMFHIYHHEINPTFFTTSSENDLYQYGLYRQLWAEGLATYVSGRLNPEASKAQILMQADLATMSQSDTRTLACFVEDHLDSTEPGDERLLFEGGRHPKGLPSRGGYYIGYLVASDVARSHSLSDLADLGGDQLHDTIRSTVHSICGN